jgi:hypothetical protein
MTWIRLDADMPWHEKIIALPNDTARFAFVKTLCAAKVRSRSSFSPESLREMLGTHAKAIPHLVAAGLLDEENGKLVVHDFEDYQRKALQAERQQRHRNVTEALPQRDMSVTEASPTGRNGTNGTYPPSPPRTFMGYRPKPERLPGEAVVPRHDGSHANCEVCEAMKAAPSIEEQQAASLADAIRKTAEREAGA